jgi:hypothetical protein
MAIVQPPSGKRTKTCAARPESPVWSSYKDPVLAINRDQLDSAASAQ